MLDETGPVVVSVSKNNSHTVSEVDVAANFVMSGNGGNNASNLPLPNNSEEPLPQEVHSATVPAEQVSIPHSVMTCVCMSVDEIYNVMKWFNILSSIIFNYCCKLFD